MEAVARWAYWFKDATLASVGDHPRAARLRRAWPNIPDDPECRWMAQSHPVQGTLVVWPRPADGSGIPLEAFGKPREIADGLTYFPSLAPFTMIDVIRPERHRGQGTWCSLYSGESLYVPLALATYRELILGAGGGLKLGGYQNEYGTLGHELFDVFVKEGIQYSDPRLTRLLFLALQQSYTLTEEMAEDIRWLGEADINPVLHAIFGIDPKALAAVPATSA